MPNPVKGDIKLLLKLLNLLKGDPAPRADDVVGKSDDARHGALGTMVAPSPSSLGAWDPTASLSESQWPNQARGPDQSLNESGWIVTMYTAECPECGAVITFDAQPLLNELVRCPDCGAELEVVSLDPLTLALAPTEEEDWGE